MKIVRLSSISLLIPAVLAAGCTQYKPLPLTHSAVEKALAVPAPAELQARSHQRGMKLPPVELDPRKELTPDSAAILAVLLNPAVRADRNRLALSSAQLFQAGLLPNPQLAVTNDWISSGPGVVNPFSIGVTWDFTSLIWHEAKVQSAKESNASIQLDVAWTEWQAAEAAKEAVYDTVALQQQLKIAREVDQRLRQNADLLHGAMDRHEKTLLDSSAAEAAAQTAHADMLTLEQQLAHQKLVLLRTIGLPPSTEVHITGEGLLPSKLDIPPADQLLNGLEDRRLDLLALRRGYKSEEENLRVAILQQFPKINIGPTRIEDNTGVHTWGLSATVDLPIFDQYQGPIRTEQATRQKLFDEFVNRIFQSRSDISMLLADIESLTRQITAATNALPAMRQLVQTYQVAVNQGNADVLSFYTAQNDLAQKEISLLKLKQQLVDSRVALEIASGRDLPQPATTAQTRPQTAEVEP
ncbi:MAG TPA: TolC family protein [Tepidisphaeraceae bacterium]|nr:TolC family protein [Tepidisphaeraceae bacterium]